MIRTSFRCMAGNKQFVDILGDRMAYVESGHGRPIVFLHGNPTSSYLWRSVMPEVVGEGRCIAPDLMGMGDSPKIDSLYRFADHRTHIDGLFEALGITSDAILVGHDWGGALLFDWAFRHQHAVAGFVYMETIVAPLTWDDWPEASREIFQAMRSDAGEGMVLGKNMFVERILPGSVLRPLDEATMAEYRRPFPSPESRLPTLTWPRQIPIDGVPEDVDRFVADYAAWMSENQLPKLFINADPGAILVGAQREFARTWPNQREVTVPGVHFIQEDSGPQIGQAIRDFVKSV